MKEKRRIHYVSPCMDCIRVEAESDFMSGSVIKETSQSKVVSSGQEIGDEFDAGTGEGGAAWKDTSWE